MIEQQPGLGAEDEEEPIGGEVRVHRGGTPRSLLWTGYTLYAAAALYLLVHPPIEHRGIILAFAAIITAWLLYFALRRKPSEL